MKRFVIFGLLFACSGQTTGPIEDSGQQQVESDAEADTGSDAEVGTGSDAEADTGSDAEADTGSDAEADTGSDAEADTGSDAEADTGSDAEVDTGSDAEVDTGSDAEVDTGSDAEVDTGSDAEVDTGSDAEVRWDSSSSVLRHYGEDVILKGFSGTTTEYLFDGLGMDTFWDTDFSTPFQESTSRISLSMLSRYGQDNFQTVYENDLGIAAESPEPENVANRFFSEGIAARLNEVEHPVFRIPLTARYWLEGGKKVFTYSGQVTAYDRDSRTVTYAWGSTGTLTGDVELIEDGGSFLLVQSYSAQEYQEHITDLIFYIKEEVPSAVIILDLHWNFDRFGDTSTFDTINDESTESGAYAKQLPMALDRDSTGSRAGSAIRFWESVAETFGHRGDALVDGVLADADSTHTNHIQLSANPSVDIDFAQDIWFELYNEPHTDKFTSYTVDGRTPVSVDDNTSGTAPSDWDGFLNGVASDIDEATFAGMLDLYEAVRERADNHVLLSAGSNYAWGAESLVALHTAINADAELQWRNIILNVHPYMGFYQAGDSSKDAEGFLSVVETLSTLDAPIMITEFGQYDGPAKINFNETTLRADDPDDNWNFVGSSTLSASSTGNSNLYEWYHYAGYWDAATGTETGTAMSYNEAILQICEDYQVSWTAWASRPNSFVSGTSTGSTQPDVFTGLDATGNPDLQLTNPTTALNAQHRDQPMVKDTATGGGSNWAYLWSRFAAE